VAVSDVNEEVLIAIEEHLFTAEALEATILLTERDDVEDRQATLAREREDAERRISRLVAAIESAGHSAALVSKLTTLETRLRTIEEETANLHPVPRLAPAVIESRFKEYKRLLRQSSTQARTVLQRILRGRIVFTPRADGRGYDFAAATRWDRVFAGVATPRPKWIPAGTSGVEHPHEKDYGELLEKRALGLASPRGLSKLVKVGGPLLSVTRPTAKRKNRNRRSPQIPGRAQLGRSSFVFYMSSPVCPPRWYELDQPTTCARRPQHGYRTL
jgi:hypothetical protein